MERMIFMACRIATHVRRKIFGGQAMTHLILAIVAYLLLLALVLMFNHGAHRH